MKEPLNIEESTLDQYFEGLEKMDIRVPDALNQRVKDRIDKLKPKRHYIRNCVAAGIALCIIFVGGVKFSSGFASYATTIPVLKTAIQWLQGDTGVMNAKDHGYKALKTVTTTQEGYTLSLDHIMLDEDRLTFSLFISTKDNKKAKETKPDAGGENTSEMNATDPAFFPEVRFHDFMDSASVQALDSMEDGTIACKIEKVFKEGELKNFLGTSPKEIAVNISLRKDRERFFTFSPVCISLEGVRVKDSKTYAQSQSISLEQLKLNIHKLTVNPTRMKLEFSPQMQKGYSFTEFENPYIKDDKGNIYKPEGLVSKTEGTKASNLYFVPSVYFDTMPHKLFFCFDGIRIASDEGRKFTLSTTDNYPKTLQYMGQSIVIQSLRYDDNGALSINFTGPSEKVLKLQGIDITSKSAEKSWGLHEADDKMTVDYFSTLSGVKKQKVYDLEYDYVGYLLPAFTSIPLEYR